MKAIRKEVLVVLCFCLIPTMTAGLWSSSWGGTEEHALLDHLYTTYDPGDQQGFHPPLSRLIYTGQTGPKSEYTVTGFPGCAPPSSQIICQFPDGSQALVDTAISDGSFAFSVPHAKDSTRVGFSLRARNADGIVTSAALARTDFPLMGGMWLDPTQRGWVNLAVAEANEQADMQAWQDYKTVHRESGERLKRWAENQGKSGRQLGALLRQLKEQGIALPESLSSSMVSPLEQMVRQHVPQDLKIYGYAPGGEMATCVLPHDGSSFVEPVRADSTFSVRIPREEVAAGEDGHFSYLVNITDRSNRLLASVRFSGPSPRWAKKSLQLLRKMESSNAQQQALIGQRAPDLTLERSGSPEVISLQKLGGRVVMLNIWATWCGACVEELKTIQKLYPQLQKTGIELLTIDVWEPIERAQSLLLQKGYTFPVLRDIKGTMIDSLKITGVPTTIVLDRAGIIRVIEDGFLTEDEFWAALRKGGVE